jgi:hypothetical protein
MRTMALVCLIGVAATAQAHAGSCLWKRQEESGSNKICWYACSHGDTAVTIRATRPCPLKIER